MLNIGLLLKKYSVSILFLNFGLALVYVAFTSEQSLTFKLAASLVFISSLISFLNVSGYLSAILTRIIGFSSLIVALVVLYLSYYSVSDTMVEQKNYKMCKELSRINLSDLRTAQKAYFERYNSYAQDWGTIINFIKSDSANSVVSEGSVPSRKITESERNFIYRDNRPIDENMTELEAYKLSISRICPDDLKDFKRDSVKVSFIKTNFTENKSYIKERLDNNLGEFNADDLKYIPFTNKKYQWNIKTNKVLMGLDSIYTLRVEGEIPFTKVKGQKTKEIIYFGKLEINDLSGSWEEE